MSSRKISDFQYEIGARIGRGDWSGAAAAASACRTTWPADPAGWVLGSIAALFAGEVPQALALAEAALMRAPRDLQCLLQHAECLLQSGQRAAAMQSADAAAVNAAGVPAALDAVGEFLVQAGDHERALAVYTQAVTAAPTDTSLLSKRAVVQRFLGNFDAAIADYEVVIHLTPLDAEALKGLAELRTQTPERNGVTSMESALAVTSPDSKDAATLHFGLAKSYEDLADYSASWRHLTTANRMERARIPYEPQQDRAAIQNIIEGFPSARAVQPDSTGERPIFIIGMPRTGTTLVERIIGRHSQVHSAGELTALSEAIGVNIKRNGSGQPVRDWASYAAALRDLDGPSIAREYLDRVRARRGDRPRFSDKQPVNFFYCGLILRAFPNARIVHLVRHPLATCYAIFKTRFGGTYPFSYDLAELGEFYLGYRRLMSHWHHILPGRIHDVAYEDVVTQLEPTTRTLLEFIDLPFEAACLEFHRNPDSTATASSVQVRQPLYDSSLHQWRHYASELGPLKDRLEAQGINVTE